MATRRQKEQRERQKSSAKTWAEQKTTTFEATCVKLPEGFNFLKLEVPRESSKIKLDVLPYVAGAGNPNADEGFDHFERTYFSHRGLGPDGKTILACPRLCFGKRCYVCEWVNRQGGNADQDFVRKLRPQARLLLNVMDVTSDVSRDKGIQIIDQPYGSGARPFFGELLKSKIAMVEDYEDFWTLDKGKTMVCQIVSDKIGDGNPYAKITSIEFIPRKAEYDEDTIEKTCCLDEVLVEISYDEMREKAYLEPDAIPVESNGRDSRPHEDEDVPKSRTKSAAKDEDDKEDEDDIPVKSTKKITKPAAKSKKEKTAEDYGIEVGTVVTYKGLECDVIKVSGDGTSLTLEDEDKDTYKGIDPGDVEVVETADEPPPKKESKPASKPTKKAPVVEDDEEEDEDDSDMEEDEDEEDEPPAKVVKKRR